jgi:hypothetical protein
LCWLSCNPPGKFEEEAEIYHLLPIQKKRPFSPQTSEKGRLRQSNQPFLLLIGTRCRCFDSDSKVSVLGKSSLGGVTGFGVCWVLVGGDRKEVGMERRLVVLVGVVGVVFGCSRAVFVRVAFVGVMFDM